MKILQVFSKGRTGDILKPYAKATPLTENWLDLWLFCAFLFNIPLVLLMNISFSFV